MIGTNPPCMKCAPVDVMNQHQQRLWKTMIGLIDSYLSGGNKISVKLLVTLRVP